MKAKRAVSSLLAAVIVALAAGCATEPSQEQLLPQAKISLAQAQQTALARAGGGTVQSSELEREQGKLVWSFDIAKPGSRDIIEVLVDAVTGEVVSTETETPAQQEKETREDAKKGTGRSWTENVTAPAEPFASSGRNRYFILEPGHQLAFEGKENGKTVNLTITVLDETRQVAGVQTRVVEERETADGNLVEVSRNYLAIGAQSHHVYSFGEDVDVYRGEKVLHEGAWLAGANGATCGIAMPGDAKVGARYYQERAPQVAMDRAENVSTRETVNTTAGRFVNCLKVKETTPLEPGNLEYKFYAPEVGLVQDGPLKLVRYGFVKK